MGIGISGINSGMDTDSIVEALVMEKTAKRDKLVKAQKKLEWKQDLWKELNTKIYNFYTKSLSNMRMIGSYNKKKTSVSDPTVATVVANGSSVNGSQALRVEKLATAGYLTGGRVKTASGEKVSNSTKLSELDGFSSGSVNVKVGDKETTINIDSETTVKDFVSELQNAGVNASFDADNQRFFISAKDSGKANDFTLTASGGANLKAMGLDTSGNAGTGGKVTENTKLNELEGFTFGSDTITIGGITVDGNTTIKEVISKLQDKGISASFDESNQKISVNGVSKDLALAASSNTDGTGAVRIAGEDAVIYLNGAKYESSSNTFSVNGLTITAQGLTGEDEKGNPKSVNITTSQDTEGIYNMVKDFLKSYNELINELDSLYNAKSAKGYEPLTDEEKEAMSDKEVELWEDKIKGSLLRRDSSLNNIIQVLKNSMAGGTTINGKKSYLSEFGIETGGYLYAAENERGAYHIDGDEDDALFNEKTNKLMAAIVADPDHVAETLSGIATNLYDSMTKAMRTTKLSSTYTVYNDKQMKEEYDSYTEKIAAQEEKITWWEDYYRSKFTAMEKMLASLNQQQSSLSGMLG